ELAEKLTLARQRAAHPVAEAWGEARSLTALLDDAADPVDVRTRLRTALRSTVAEVWLLVVPRGRVRLAVAQVRFAGGEAHRDYALMHHSPWGGPGGERREGRWQAVALADVVKLGPLDLRKRDHAARLEAALLKLDLSGL